MADEVVADVSQLKLDVLPTFNIKCKHIKNFPLWEIDCQIIDG